MSHTGDDGWSAPIVFTLWLTAVAVVFLAVHVALGYGRSAGRENGGGAKAVPLGLAAAALGTGLWAAALLAISTPDVVFPLGYRALGVVVAWLSALAGAVVVVALLGLHPRRGMLFLAAAVAAATAVGVQALLLDALGLRPGLPPRHEAAVAAFVLAAGGFGAGFWIALAGPGTEGRRRRYWRWAGALAAGFGVALAQALGVAATGIEAQVGSLYANQVPTAAAALAAGVGVPLLLLVAVGDLHLRRLKTGVPPPRPKSRGRRLRRLQ